MLLLLLLVVKPCLTLEQKNAILTNPEKKEPITNFAPMPTFPSLFFTTLHPKSSPFSGLQRQRKKKAEKKRERGNVLSNFLLATETPPLQHHTSTSLTYHGVPRSLIELLRAKLRQTPPASSSPLLDLTASNNVSTCSFLSGSMLPLSGTCTASSGACQVGRTDYQAAACSNTQATSLGHPCAVNRPLKRTKGTCSSEGQLQCLMNNLKPR